MMIAYKPQSLNPDKPELMPDDYYWEKYEIEDSMQERFVADGYTVLSVVNFEAAMAAIDLTAYNASLLPSAEQVVLKKILEAQAFGNELLLEFSKENVLMGITQAGKTEVVTKYLHFIEHFVDIGSLYAAMNEIGVKITEGVPGELAPFVTNERLVVFLNKIKVYLGIPI